MDLQKAFALKNMWSYAKLSHMAKEFGGPEALVENIIKSSERIGAQKMAPFILIALIAGCGITLVFSKYRDEAQLEDMKTELIAGIKEYDSTHPTDEFAESPKRTENEEKNINNEEAKE